MGCLNNTHNTAHALGIPHGAKVALMNLSWDSGNTAYVGRGAVPILLQVMNVNSSSPKSVGLLGYLPVIDHGSKGHTNYATATNHVLQKTIGFLLASIEARTQFGFLCNIGSDMFKFYPRIGAMSLDTMERVKYFGLRSVRACGICRLRKGRSVTRKATRHDPVTVAQLYDQANADVRGKDNKRQRKLCRDKLRRHGFKHETQCQLPYYCNKSLVHIPDFGPAMFGGLVRYERMHVYYLGFCKYLLQLLLDLTPKAKYIWVNKAARSCHQFRDPRTGVVHPKLSIITTMTYFTAEKMVRAVFYWAHVLGLRAQVIPEPCRQHAQMAVATLQLILICTRGHRSYTSTELDVIFGKVGRTFFQSLEAMAKWLHDEKFTKQLQDHTRDPDKHRMPSPWERVAKFDSGTDSVETDPEDSWGCMGRYEYSGMGIPHALKHARELVECGGHHAAYCTSVVESSHKENIKMASLYSRTYANYNTSQNDMFRWVLREVLWDAVHVLHKKRQSTPPGGVSSASETTDTCPVGVSTASQKKSTCSYKLYGLREYTTGWSHQVTFDSRGRTTPPEWKKTFLSSNVLITREELLLLVLQKLGLPPTIASMSKIVKELQFQCYARLSMKSSCGTQRNIVGIDTSGRRDFMRLKGEKDGTTLSVQIIMFVHVSGFSDDNIKLPSRLRNPTTNSASVVLALVRWLSPHPNAVLRDSERRPVCPAPFDINHSLWKFTKLSRTRESFNRRNIERQLHLFGGQRARADRLSKARYDLYEIENLNYFINCTHIDDNSDVLLETHVLPF